LKCRFLKFDFKLLLQTRQCGKLCISGREAAPAQAAEGIIVLMKNFHFASCRMRFPLHLKEKTSMVNLLDQTTIQERISRMLHKSSRSEETLLFAKNFLQHPRMLGSLIPSSRFLIDRLMSKIDWKRARTIVEYGPGVGTITAHILERMDPEARLVVFEMNERFVRYLVRAFPDSRLHIVHGSAENVHKELERLKLEGADYVISGIPFNHMRFEIREKITRRTREALNPGGEVLIYQFTRTVLPHLRTHFDKVYQEFELRNFLPALLFHCI